MRIPAYPLITCEPFFSIWSKSDKLYDSDTILWCGITKRLHGYFFVDGIKFRFSGVSDVPNAQQTAIEISPLITSYSFTAGGAQIDVEFFSPLFPDDLYLLSTPCSFIRYTTKSIDGKHHSVKAELKFGEEFCYDGEEKSVSKENVLLKNIKCCKMGRTEQEPLSEYGDGVSADWGYLYVAGEDCVISDNKEEALGAVCLLETDSKNVGWNVVAFDDVYSVEFLGKKLKGLWTERFLEITDAIEYCCENKLLLYKKAKEWNERVVEDSAPFGESYTKVLTAAFRQILAAHKLVRAESGELLYLSKECHSNGSINTVDVTYPALPMFLLYNPELVKAMLTGIFIFAQTPCWNFDFAPHDLGTYPLADGQTYALKNSDEFSATEKRCGIFLHEDDVYNFDNQMPVEESGNMIIASYAYYKFSNDTDYLNERYELLKKWADYLLSKGISLENQLCTDDFAGHSEKNVNLAIKSIVGLACFGKICESLKKDGAVYYEQAKKNAAQLYKISEENGYMTFAIGEKNSWSLKYNLVWDMLFELDLFDKKLYKYESEKYFSQMNKYGIPLDYRATFTKSDWMMWASTLDETGKNISLFSDCILDFLRDTQDRNCFTDWFDTVEAKECGMDHRSVQAGLWMPVLKEKIAKSKNFN